MLGNRTYTGRLGAIIACAVLLFAGLGMGKESKTSGDVPDINETRREVQADSEAVHSPVRDEDFVKVSELSSRIVDKYGSIEDTVVQRYVIEARWRVAHGMYMKNDYGKALRSYEQIEKKYGKMDDETIQLWVVSSIYYRALVYKYGLEDYRKALKHFKRVQNEYKKPADDNTLRVVADARYEEGLTHEKLGKMNMAEKCFREVIREFGKNENEIIKGTVLKAQEELDKKKS